MKSKLLFLGFLFFNFILFSQTIQEKKLILKETNVSKLLKISKSKKTKFIEDKKLALSLAKIKGWQVFIEDSKGSFSELIKVDTERNPIYYSTYNYGAGLTARTNHLYTGGSLGLNIEGQNMIAGEWDGGAVLPTHELFEGRVTQMDGASSTHYHSTHVAGTIMGTDQVQGGNARGMAFKANLHAYEWNSDQAEVAQAAANGLLISNHSYGYNPGYLSLHQFGKYDSDANTFDDIMYNAPYYLFVAAAGNARDDGINSGDGGYDLLSGHSCTKNSIVVAAVQELTNYTGASSVNMSYFSSWGPTDDGRIKPDISAKGVDTFSASDNSDTDYITISGTSMASPSVTGTLLLMQQYYNQQNSQFMRSATLRGLALHTADEAGNNPGPDYEFGWGLINAKKAAEVIRDNGLLSHISEETLNQGASYSISFDALGSEPLKASICWTDPAGTIITNTVEDFYSPALVNDLDIRITQNGTTYYPWKLDPNNLSVAATQGDNIVDNIEKVEINNPVGLYTLTVTHKGNLQSGSQNFSVIVSGISFNDFYITSSNEKQNICEGDDIAQFNLDLSTISGFSDTVTFSTINLPAGVNASFSPIALNSAGNFTLDLTNLSGLATGVYPFIIHGQSSSDVADLNVELQVYDASFATQILSSPTNNATSIPLEVDLLWEDNLNAQQYLIQIATDIAFTNIIESSSISQNNYQTAILNNNTTYYWRVQPTNICGDGSFSSIYSFTTVCLEPTNVTTSNALLDSVDVSWTENSGGTNWEIEIVEAGNSPIGIGSLANTNPYTLTGLNSSTEYTVYVRSNCGNGNFSEWGVSAPFITAADFCSGDHFYDTGGASGSYSNNENTVTTIVPSIGFNTVSVQFNTFSLESCCDYLQIYNGSDTNAPLIGSYTYNPGTITSSNANGALTFLFHSDSSVIYDGWDATVTCINISCPAPTNLSSTNITLNSVDLSWIAGDTETDWEIEYGLAGFTQGTGIIEQIAINPYILSGLNSSTNYDVYLRANCGINPGDDDSLWVGPINFTTLVSCPAPTNLSSTNITLNSVDLSWIAGSTETAWEIEYGSSGFTQGTGTVVQTTTNPFTLTGLNASTNYDVYLRASCGTNPGDDDSLWIGPINFTTLVSCPTPTNFNSANTMVDSVDLSWTAGASETNWEIEYGLSGFMQGNGTVVQATTNPFTLTGLNQDTNYDVYLRANCGTNPEDDDSLWVGPINFTTYIDYCNGEHFYDSGGEFGNYSHGESIITTIIPTDGYNAVEVIFNSFEVSNFDTLRIYNGPDVNSTLLGVYNGGDFYHSDFPDSFISTHAAGALTFWFTSSSSVTEQGASGWDATVNCVNISCYDPTNFSSINETDTSVDLLWTAGNLETNWEIEYGIAGFIQGTGTAIQVNTNLHTISGLNQNTCYDVYLRSNCDDGSDSNWVKDSFITLKVEIPNNLTANINQSNGNVSLNWNETSYTLKEDFNDGYANGWQFERGPWYVHQGVYIGLHDGIAITSSYYPQVFSNYIMQFKMRKDGWHSSLGVYFNGDPSEYHGNGAWENTYSLEYCNYTSANWKLSKIVDGTWTTIKGWTDSNSLIAGPGVWNKVKIVSSNGYFDIYFNDVLNVSFYDDTFTDGVVGFMGASDNNAVNVDDFTLTELNCSYVFDNTNSTSNDAHTDRETQDFINYNIYRNGVIIATTSQTTYTETLPAYGTYNYYVSSVYDSGESNVSNTETVVWTNTASIDDLSQFNFKYHPNPFENTLTLSANQEFTSIKVYSLLGQELMDINLENQTNLTIDMSKLNVGTYFMKVEINNKSSSMKIIKK